MYEILPMDEQRRIVIQHETAAEYIDSFIELLRSIQSELKGELMPRPDKGFCYELETKEFRLIFQWDRKTGILAIVPEETDAQTAISLLSRHCERLNQPVPEAPAAKVAVHRTTRNKKRNE